MGIFPREGLGEGRGIRSSGFFLLPLEEDPVWEVRPLAGGGEAESSRWEWSQGNGLGVPTWRRVSPFPDTERVGDESQLESEESESAAPRSVDKLKWTLPSLFFFPK